MSKIKQINLNTTLSSLQSNLNNLLNNLNDLEIGKTLDIRMNIGMQKISFKVKKVFEGKVSK